MLPPLPLPLPLPLQLAVALALRLPLLLSLPLPLPLLLLLLLLLLLELPPPPAAAAATAVAAAAAAAAGSGSAERAEHVGLGHEDRLRVVRHEHGERGAAERPLRRRPQRRVLEREREEAHMQCTCTGQPDAHAPAAHTMCSGLSGALSTECTGV